MFGFFTRTVARETVQTVASAGIGMSILYTGKQISTVFFPPGETQNPSEANPTEHPQKIKNGFDK